MKRSGTQLSQQVYAFLTYVQTTEQETRGNGKEKDSAKIGNLTKVTSNGCAASQTRSNGSSLPFGKTSADDQIWLGGGGGGRGEADVVPRAGSPRSFQIQKSVFSHDLFFGGTPFAVYAYSLSNRRFEY